MAYVPPSIPVKQSEWPTLGELINSGKRVIVFMDFNTYVLDLLRCQQTGDIRV